MTLKIPGSSPSQGAKSTGYRVTQGDDAQVIYDGRWAWDGISSTISPPIQLYHPVFDEFLYLANSPDTQPTAKDLRDVYEFMWFLSEVGRSENKLGEGLRARLTNILGFTIHEETIFHRTRPDGVITVQIGNTRILTLIIELKRELGEGGCDPSIQVSLTMRRSWIDSDVGYKHIHLDIMSDSSIESCHSRKVLLSNILDRCRGTMAQYSGWRIHRQGYYPAPD